MIFTFAAMLMVGVAVYRLMSRQTKGKATTLGIPPFIVFATENIPMVIGKPVWRSKPHFVPPKLLYLPA